MPPPLHAELRPVSRLVVALLVLSPLALAVPALRRSGEPDPPADPPATKGATPTEREPSPLPRPMLGFALNAHHIGDLSLYLEAVDAVADLGANTLMIVTPQFQERVNSDRIRRRAARCPTRDQLLAILERAGDRGLHTALMPIVLIEKPGKKDWRGLIEPRDWDAWWESYDEFLDWFVRLAVEADVDLLSIGSELNSTEDQIERWERIIEDVRSRYHGRLTYSANWDRYDQVTFWPRLDVMSVSAYFELERSRPGAPEEDLVRAWTPIRRTLIRAAETWERPLLLSELGYPSLPSANAHPWDYVAERDERADHDAQARCWRAFFTAWREEIDRPGGPLLGFCGYRWDPYHHGDGRDTGYGIEGKPAYEVIRRAFAEIAARRPGT